MISTELLCFIRILEHVGSTGSMFGYFAIALLNNFLLSMAGNQQESHEHNNDCSSNKDTNATILYGSLIILRSSFAVAVAKQATKKQLTSSSNNVMGVQQHCH